jgi:hypothetical protein
VHVIETVAWQCLAVDGEYRGIYVVSCGGEGCRRELAGVGMTNNAMSYYDRVARQAGSTRKQNELQCHLVLDGVLLLSHVPLRLNAKTRQNFF